MSAGTCGGGSPPPAAAVALGGSTPLEPIICGAAATEGGLPPSSQLSEVPLQPIICGAPAAAAGGVYPPRHPGQLQRQRVNPPRPTAAASSV